MKKLLTSFCLWLAGLSTFGQGLVDFRNGPSTLVSFGPPGQSQLIPPSSQSTFYFGLLTGPTPTNLSMFTFSGVYATNTTVAGQLSGGSEVVVPGWGPLTAEYFLVAGWSASLGHDWNSGWLNGSFGASGFWGISAIGEGVAGGSGGGVPPPPLPLFNTRGGIPTGWNLNPVPEPSSGALLFVGLATLVLQHRKTKRRPT